jgi:hypothetical protein
MITIKNRSAPPRAGQAIVELIVALVVLLVVIGGVITLGRLSRAQTVAMREARRVAGVAALSDAAPFSGPLYIEERTAGGDAVTYSRDDGTTAGEAADFQNRVVSYGEPEALGEALPGNEVSVLYGTAFPQFMFSFTHGEHDVTVTNMPIVRHTMYNAETIQVHGEAWLTWTKGIY